MSSEPTVGVRDTRTRILDAAWALLEERGIGVRLVDIAERAGVTRQTLYLHFGDRVSLFVALGDYVDVTFGRDRLRAHVFGAPTAIESLRRWVETMSWYTAKIDAVSRILELAAESDDAIAAAWRDRMIGRRGHVGRIADRLASEGDLADGWTPEAAADLIYAVTLPGPWRALTSIGGWSIERYAQDISAILERSLLGGRRSSPGEKTA